MKSAKSGIAISMKLSGLSYTEIAEKIGCSYQNVQQLCRPSDQMRWEIKRLAKFRCQECGVPIRSGHIHHISYSVSIQYFNALCNLMYLCGRCHRRMHPQDPAKTAERKYQRAVAMALLDKQRS